MHDNFMFFILILIKKISILVKNRNLIKKIDLKLFLLLKNMISDQTTNFISCNQKSNSFKNLLQKIIYTSKVKVTFVSIMFVLYGQIKVNAVSGEDSDNVKKYSLKKICKIPEI